MRNLFIPDNIEKKRNSFVSVDYEAQNWLQDYIVVMFDKTSFTTDEVLELVKVPHKFSDSLAKWDVELMKIADEPVFCVNPAKQETIVSPFNKNLSNDPFSISLKDFLNLDYKKVIELQNQVSKQCKELIRTAWENGKKQIVICNGYAVYQTSESEDISNKFVKELTEKYQKPCYVFVAPDKIEECGWTEIGGSKPPYPTICLHIGTPSSEESDLIQNPPIEADFDTGNHYLRAFDAGMFPEYLATFSPSELRYGEHLNVSYPFLQKTVKICVKDESGRTYSVTCPVRMLTNWSGSPLLQLSPNRLGFVGRDLLRDLGTKIELDPSRKITRILGS